jgi:hypothetical protein
MLPIANAWDIRFAGGALTSSVSMIDAPRRGGDDGAEVRYTRAAWCATHAAPSDGASVGKIVGATVMGTADTLVLTDRGVGAKMTAPSGARCACGVRGETSDAAAASLPAPWRPTCATGPIGLKGERLSSCCRPSSDVPSGGERFADLNAAAASSSPSATADRDDGAALFLLGADVPSGIRVKAALIALVRDIVRTVSV